METLTLIGVGVVLLVAGGYERRQQRRRREAERQYVLARLDGYIS